jgi:K+-transporting ATPase ATPase A chain
MEPFAVLQAAAFLVVLTLVTRPLGGYLARVFTGQQTAPDVVLRTIERGIYRMTGVDADAEMDWRQYAAAFVRFGVLGVLLLYLILRLQHALPWAMPASGVTPMTPDLAMNTAVSFATTTTWQAYAGEITMSYFSQMAGLTAQNFLAGAAGLAVGMAFIRGFARGQTNALGNFWVDLVRALLWVLLPIALVGGLLLVWQGVPANLNPYAVVRTLVGVELALPQGPVAALELIKNLGTNGGGFFNANAAHPYENPTPLTNVLELFAILVVPAALTKAFGRMVGRERHGWVLYAVMVVLFVAGLAVCQWAEHDGNPALAALTNPGEQFAAQPGGNLEGKEVRFGIAGSTLAAVVTSNGATGSFNSMHDSYTPVGVLVPLFNMLLGEIVFGGLGTGIYSIVLVALLGLFLTGLMVGRTPEYLGRKIGPDETKLITIYTLLAPLAILPLTAAAVASDAGLAGLTTNDGARGLTEILYAYATSMANNGQNMAGLSANSPFYNWTTALAMLLGRFGLGVVALVLAGRFAGQVRRGPSAGAMSTESILFAMLVTCTAILVGGLTFLPALALGPIVEQLIMAAAP